MREADLMVTLDDTYGNRYSAAYKIAGPMMEAFDPVDVCSDARVALMLGHHTEETVKIVRRCRKDYAKILAAALAEKLLEVMGAKDTRNGYDPTR